MLEESELTRRLAGQHVDTYAFPDGRYEVRHTGVPLAYRLFDKDQRVASGVIAGRKGPCCTDRPRDSLWEVGCIAGRDDQTCPDPLPHAELAILQRGAA